MAILHQTTGILFVLRHIPCHEQQEEIGAIQAFVAWVAIFTGA
jgi:hypothetical protein